MLKKYLVAISFVVLCGCMSETPKLSKYDPNLQYLPQQATVVVRIDNFDYLDLSRVDRVANVEFAPEHIIEPSNSNASADPTKNSGQYFKLDLGNMLKNDKPHRSANDYRVLKPARWVVPHSYAQAIYTIEPGIYYISYVASEMSEKVYFSSEPGVHDNKITYGAFEIKPGEVLYLGDIECRWKSSVKVKNIVINDRFAEVKQDLVAAGYLQVANKIQKAKFFKAGTTLSLNKQGAYELQEVH